MVSDLPELLIGSDFRSPSGEAPILVFNNSRVRKARLRARLKTTSIGTNSLGEATSTRKTEFLLLNRVDTLTWRVMTNRTKRRRPKQRYCFACGIEGEIVEAPPNTLINDNTGEFRYLRFDSPIDDDWLDIHGHMPLPPYIKRDDEETDSKRYQTIYADRSAGLELGPGASAAAPTAGLHFTEEMFARLDAAGIEKTFITLHIGLGTFLPVRTEYVEDHVMHEEMYSISEEAAREINEAKAKERKIICVGTTSIRTLESACTNKEEAEKTLVKPGKGAASIFIYPGYRFKLADALFTNFHTSGSTLLMLASAFAGAKDSSCDGRQMILDSYAEAIREQYRFFSYGDAMLMY